MWWWRWWCNTVGNGNSPRRHQQHILLLLLIVNIPLLTLGTTEWFGDLRAHMNPARASPFYDVIYDDSECADGLVSEAIPDYAYFGPMVASMSAEKHAQCLDICIKHPKCVAVNFFAPMTFQEDGFCELLSESQLDNPRLMRPFKAAAYFENIRCRVEDNDFINQDNEEKTFERPKTRVTTLLKKIDAQVDQFNLLNRQRS